MKQYLWKHIRVKYYQRLTEEKVILFIKLANSSVVTNLDLHPLFHFVPHRIFHRISKISRIFTGSKWPNIKFSKFSPCSDKVFIGSPGFQQIFLRINKIWGNFLRISHCVQLHRNSETGCLKHSFALNYVNRAKGRIAAVKFW